MAFPIAPILPAKDFTRLRKWKSWWLLSGGGECVSRRKGEGAPGRGLKKVSTIVKEGFDADEIISLAQQIPDNLIAMCTHGRSGIKRWALGSVTETVVRHSGDPVLIVRAA